MKAVLTIMAVVVGALTATSAAHAQAACPPGNVAVPHARVVADKTKLAATVCAMVFRRGNPKVIEDDAGLTEAAIC